MTDFKRVFVDTAPIIYCLENNPMYSEKIKSFFAECMKNKVQVVTSAITIEEYLVYPYLNDKTELVSNFKNFLKYMDIEIIEINAEIAEQGAKLRGKYQGFKAMDALQIASAILGGCDMFFTNDKQLRQEKEIPCMTMEDLL